MEHRKRNLLIFLGTLCVAGIFMMLNAIFNKGTLMIRGAYPFEVEVDGQIVVCSADPCTVELMKGKYSVISRKSGYFEVKNDISIERGEELSLVIDFKFIPIVEKLGARMKYQVGPDVYGLGETRLSVGEVIEIRPLPSEYEDVQVSQSGNFAVFTEGGSVSLLDMEKQNLKKMNFGKVAAVKFAPMSDVLYYLADAKAGEEPRAEQVLYTYSSGKNEKKFFFTESFVQPRLFVAGGEHAVYVYEEVTGELYEVNLLESSVVKLTTIQGLSDVIVSPDTKTVLLGVDYRDDNVLRGFLNYQVLGNESVSFVSSIGAVLFLDANSLVYATLGGESPIEDLDIIDGASSVVMKVTLHDGKSTQVYVYDGIINRLSENPDTRAVMFGTETEIYSIRLEEIK